MSLGTATPCGGDHDDDNDDHGRDGHHDDHGSHGGGHGEWNLSSLFNWLTRDVLGRIDSVPGVGGRESSVSGHEHGSGIDSIRLQGAGQDTIVFQHSGAGNDTITFGQGHDTVRELGSATAPGGRGWANIEAEAEARQSGRNNDSVFAGSGDSTLIAGSHETSFVGDRFSSARPLHHGDDTIVGGSGIPESGSAATGPPQSTFSFDTQQAGGTHLFSSFAQGPNPVDSSHQNPAGEFTVSGGHTTTSGESTVIALDERTTIRITDNTHH